MTLSEELLKEGGGVYRLAPTWAPRAFCRPAKRIKLHPDDYYILGQERGGIDEFLPLFLVFTGFRKTACSL